MLFCDVEYQQLPFTIESATASEVIAFLRQADDAYFNEDADIIPDHVYDSLKRYAAQLDPSNEYFGVVGSDVRGGKIDLPHSMGSLNQIHVGDYSKWVQDNMLVGRSVVVTDKLDGASVMLSYAASGKFNISYSRGDGLKGADNYRHLSLIPSVPSSIANKSGDTVFVRAEVIISKPNFAQVRNLVLTRSGKQYRNPRNMVSGLLNASTNNPIVYPYVDVVAYEIIGSSLDKSQQLHQLAEWGFTVVHSEIGMAEVLTDEVLTVMLNERRAASVYELDGVVIDVDLFDIRSRLNPTANTLNPVYSVKYKVADALNEAVVVVEEVEWKISKDGYLKPRVRITPTDLCGVTIRHATGFNAKFIRDNGIGPGASIRITRSGDVIPYIVAVEVPAPQPQMPSGDVVWSQTGVDLILADVDGSESVQVERLNDFFDTIGASNMREGNLQKLFDLGCTSPESIILLSKEDLEVALGSKVVGGKVFEGIRSKLVDIPMHVLMGAHSSFGRGVGVRKMKKLYEAMQGNTNRMRSIDNIVVVEGFDSKTASKIVAGWEEFDAFIEAVSPVVTIAPYVDRSGGAMSGLVVVFTGIRDKPLEQAVEAAGGKIGSSVSSKTSLLVMADPTSNSSKATKARELGVKVIGITELQSMVRDV